MTLDLKDYFLASPMPQPAFMIIPSTYIPPDIYSKYNLESELKIVLNIAQSKTSSATSLQFLKQNLEPHGYIPIPYTTGRWKHEYRKIVFCLCVDDFGVKYYKK